jgi:D-arabinose 1-dehydrogenase-like Zn-dependent alcohol dehydrogenase
VELPAILGHEVLGEVVELGPTATGLAVGDNVTLHATLMCGRCRMCRTAREPLCLHARGGIGRHIPGGYAEFMAVPDRNCVKVPPAVIERHGVAGAALICDAMTTPYKVLGLTALRPGEVCVAFGAAGGVGIHVIQMAKLRGATVIAVDIGADKLAAMAEQGADHVLDARAQDVVAEVRRLTDGWGADVVVDFVGAEETLKQSVAMLAAGARVAIVGISPKWDANVSALASRLVNQGQTIYGSRSFSRQEIAECLTMVATGTYSPVVNYTYPLERANEAHALVGSGRSIGRAVLVMA